MDVKVKIEKMQERIRYLTRQRDEAMYKFDKDEIDQFSYEPAMYEIG